MAKKENDKRIEEMEKGWAENQKWIEENCVDFGKMKGWVISPEWTIPFIWDLLRQERTQEEIDFVLLYYYMGNNKENLNNMFKLIRECKSQTIEQWYPLLDECIETFQHGIYRPVIPSLISVIEGIPAMLAGNPQKDHKQKIKGYCNRQAQGTTRDELKFIWLSIVNHYDSLFRSQKIRRPRHQNINRHLVQHGRDSCVKWRVIDAIQLFNTVRALSWALSEYEVNNKG